MLRVLTATFLTFLLFFILYCGEAVQSGAGVKSLTTASGASSVAGSPTYQAFSAWLDTYSVAPKGEKEHNTECYWGPGKDVYFSQLQQDLLIGDLSLLKGFVSSEIQILDELVGTKPNIPVKDCSAAADEAAGKACEAEHQTKVASAQGDFSTDLLPVIQKDLDETTDILMAILFPDHQATTANLMAVEIVKVKSILGHQYINDMFFNQFISSLPTPPDANIGNTLQEERKNYLNTLSTKYSGANMFTTAISDLAIGDKKDSLVKVGKIFDEGELGWFDLNRMNGDTKIVGIFGEFLRWRAEQQKNKCGSTDNSAAAGSNENN